jgi:hypothetical protein
MRSGVNGGQLAKSESKVKQMAALLTGIMIP